MRKLCTAVASAAGFSLMIAASGAAAQDTKLVSVLTTFGGSELEAFRQLTDRFTEVSGIQVIIESNRDSMNVLRIRVASGGPPDVALIPRPGVLAEYARNGDLVALVNADGSAGLVDPQLLTDNYAQGIIDLGSVDGTVYAILAKANSKSTIWYKPSSFAELGLQPPATWEDLLAIQKAYVDAGKKPWSIGAADAWTLTDWFENILVRTAGPDVYHKLFVTHEIAWTDAKVVEAMEALRAIFDPAELNLAGGVDGTLSTDFISAANLVFRPDNPGAEMYYEGGFMGGIIANNFPDLVPGQDFKAFLFPKFNDTYGAPVVGGGDLLAAFADRPEVAAFMKFAAGVEANTIWAKTGAIVSPNKNVDLSVYNVVAAMDATQVAEASIFVFDGSDLAPSAVGGDAMFVALQDFLAEPDDLMQILQDLEDVASRSY